MERSEDGMVYAESYAISMAYDLYTNRISIDI